MPRLTITLSDERHMALKAAAARSQKTIGSIIEESLELYGIKTADHAAELVAKARRNACMEDDMAMELVGLEVESVRQNP